MLDWLMSLFNIAAPLKKVKYPKEISQSVLVKINELAAWKGYLKISEIIAEKIGTEKYVHLTNGLVVVSVLYFASGSTNLSKVHANLNPGSSTKSR